MNTIGDVQGILNDWVATSSRIGIDIVRLAGFENPVVSVARLPLNDMDNTRQAVGGPSVADSVRHMVLCPQRVCRYGPVNGEHAIEGWWHFNHKLQQYEACV